MAAGRKTGGGSRKGRPNKLTADLKTMILGALDKAGGEEYLMRQANENPSAFMTLLGKVLPLQLQGDKQNPLPISVSFEERRRQAVEAVRAAFAERPTEREVELAAEKAREVEQRCSVPDPDQGERAEAETGRSATREFAREGSLGSAPEISRLPARYRPPRLLGSGWAG